MNRIVSVILIIVLLDLTIQNLDASKIESSLTNGQQRTDKRRNKRDGPFFAPSLYQGPCNYGEYHSCDQYATRTTQLGVQFQKTINYVQQRKFFLSGLVSLPALQNGGMCVPNTNFLNANGFSALDLGHMTVPQLSTLSLFPVQNIDVDSLLNAAYINRFGQVNTLTALGVQASLFGHIVPSQLRSLSLYPLQGDGLNSNFLQQAGYLTDDCLPTALGIAASYIRYLPNNFASSACQTVGDYPMTVERLVNNKYIYGSSKIITTVGLVAMQSGVISRDVYRNFGCFPFNVGIQTQSSEYVYQEQTQTQSTTIVSDLIHTGYLHENNLITSAAYYGITKSYFTIDNFRSLNLWPCPSTATMNMFLSAGYVSYSGHLTTLGNSLLRAQYFTPDLLSRIGLHLHDEPTIYHAALNYAGYIPSLYHDTHVAVRNGFGYSGYNGVQSQVAQYQAASSVDVQNRDDIAYAKK